MDKVFFTKSNIDTLKNKFIQNTNLKKDPRTHAQCQKIIINRMKEVYEKYGNRKPSNMSVPDFISKMSNKVVNDCVRDFNVSKQSAVQSTKSSGNQSGTFAGIPDGGLGGAGAPFSSNIQGEYITATGEVGKKMVFDVDLNDKMGIGGKKNTDVLERMMFERV